MSESINIQSLLEVAKEAALKAGEEILKVYESEDFDIELKGDNSPLTKADKISHMVISSCLEKTSLPILSEEGKEILYDTRNKWEYFWMVDPIDGTKEFIKRNGEFTVNIALIAENRPVMGVVYAPVLDELFYGIEGRGAKKKKKGEEKEIKVSSFDLSQKGLNVVASRSHLSPETEAFMSKLSDPQVVSKGSSLKLVMVAEGQADLYPRYAPTMEWDTAAAHAVVLAAGGKVYQADTEDELVYNKENLLNPYFLVLGKRNN